MTQENVVRRETDAQRDQSNELDKNVLTEEHPAIPSSGKSSTGFFEAAKARLSVIPQVPTMEDLSRLLFQNYGLKAKIKGLSSEAEYTAEVISPEKGKLIFKVSQMPEARENFLFQASAIAAVADKCGFAVPAILRTQNGSLTFDDGGYFGYLQTKLDGAHLHEVIASSEIYFKSGRALGLLDLALRPLKTPGRFRPILWHVGCWEHLQSLSGYLPEGELAYQIKASMQDYCRSVQPHLASVEWQVVHNDPSPHNILLAADKVAFIDFGDGCYGPRIQDLALAASHLVTDANLPLGGAEDFIAGYSSAVPLTPLEARIFIPLVKARQSALCLVNYWRAEIFPDEAEYIKKNVARAEHGLQILSSLTAQQAETLILSLAKITDA